MNYTHRIRAGISGRAAQNVAMRVEYHLGVGTRIEYGGEDDSSWYVFWISDVRKPDLDFLRPDVLPPPCLRDS